MTNERDQHADEIVARLTERILDAGYVIQYVPPEVGSILHGGTAYAYTVGRTLVEKPEYLVTGMPLPEVEALLREVVRMDDGTDQMRAGSYHLLSFGGELVRFKLIAANTSPLMAALMTFGMANVTAVQVLWPREGKYPSMETPWPDQPIHPHGRTPLVNRDPYAE